jgi:hypothetical protein
MLTYTLFWAYLARNKKTPREKEVRKPGGRFDVTVDGLPGFRCRIHLSDSSPNSNLRDFYHEVKCIRENIIKKVINIG